MDCGSNGIGVFISSMDCRSSAFHLGIACRDLADLPRSALSVRYFRRDVYWVKHGVFVVSVCVLEILND